MAQAADILSVNNAISAYFHALDSGDGEWFSKLFTEDGVLDAVTLGLKSEGREALRSLCVSFHETHGNCTHWAGNVLIGFAGSVATNNSYWKQINDEGKIMSAGKHEDLLVRSKTSPSEWLFKSRKMTITFTAPAAAAPAPAPAT
eukprot:TRINITY_DN3606_c0_g1_i4.p1 TRINITY_DN3606_c0_g1~~TRINITY_DN3606_c0_g1_i4.p1  ORF type:complete len:145 (-),score=35.51 TRINITY_DN3606_c0_g1_i4:96-530(-)